MKRVLTVKREAYRVKKITLKDANDTLQNYMGMIKHCNCDALKESIINNFVLTHEEKGEDNGRDCRFA